MKLPDYECDAVGCTNTFVMGAEQAVLTDFDLRQHRLCTECAARALKREG